ncbi:hypothetical protein [Roseomonas sp. BN140053]
MSLRELFSAPGFLPWLAVLGFSLLVVVCNARLARRRAAPRTGRR